MSALINLLRDTKSKGWRGLLHLTLLCNLLNNRKAPWCLFWHQFNLLPKLKQRRRRLHEGKDTVENKVECVVGEKQSGLIVFLFSKHVLHKKAVDQERRYILLLLFTFCPLYFIRTIVYSFDKLVSTNVAVVLFLSLL